MTTPTPSNPALLDRAVIPLQDHLITNLPWLKKAYGVAQRLTRVRDDRKRIFYPAVYAGSAEYLNVMPDEQFEAHSWIDAPDPMEIKTWSPAQNEIYARIGIVFWFDLQKALDDPAEHRNVDRVVADILKVLRKFRNPNGRLRVEKISKRAENIYRGYTFDEANNQATMHPFAAIRFDGLFEFLEPC